MGLGGGEAKYVTCDYPVLGLLLSRDLPVMFTLSSKWKLDRKHDLTHSMQYHKQIFFKNKGNSLRDIMHPNYYYSIDEQEASKCYLLTAVNPPPPPGC